MEEYANRALRAEPVTINADIDFMEDTVFVDGVEYAKCSVAARYLDVPAKRMCDLVRKGMPYAKSACGHHNFYPLKQCQEWLIEGNYGRRRIDRIVLDGKVYYSGKLLSECAQVHISTVGEWARNHGMPSIAYKRWTLYPLDECLEWIKRYYAKKEKPVSAEHKPSKPILCNYCDNAYAFKCSWFTNYKPVPGWEAEERVCICNGEEKPTYNVRKCPNFTPDKPRKVNLPTARQNAK